MSESRARYVDHPRRYFRKHAFNMDAVRRGRSRRYCLSRRHLVSVRLSTSKRRRSGVIYWESIKRQIDRLQEKMRKMESGKKWHSSVNEKQYNFMI